MVKQHIVTSISELAIATRTNSPITKAPEDFQQEITKAATKYIKLYARRYTDNEVAGMEELTPIVRNRIENLAVEGLAAGTISTPADVASLIRSNCLLQPAEEKAIIEAFKAGVPQAHTYIYLFFSFKVYDFMASSKLFGTTNEQDMYASLQAYLFQLVMDFDSSIIRNGGLSTNFYRQRMCDYVREVLIGKQYSLFSLNRRQVSDLHKAQQITAEDSERLSYEMLAKKYGISKVAVSLHFITMNTVRLDSPVVNGDGDKTDNYEQLLVGDTDHDFRSVEVPMQYTSMFATLKRGKKNIDEGTAKAILAVLLAYTEEAQAKSGKIKKASQHVYKNIAEQVGVPVSTVNTVIKAFAEAFA